jgi:alpha/beta superfamily hydrolase
VTVVPPPDAEGEEGDFVSGGHRIHGTIDRPRGVVRGGLVATHPHPAHGGHADHPVVATASRRAAAAGLYALRFDFRGVRESEGDVTDATGHLEDVRQAVRHVRSEAAAGPLLGAGFSYGARMFARSVHRDTPDPPRVNGLILLAPATRVPQTARDFGNLLLGRALRDAPADAKALVHLGGIPLPVHVIVGERDPVAPPDELAAALPSHARLVVLPGLNHFFSRSTGAGPTETGPLEEAIDDAIADLLLDF